jgi:hypothetical protein
MKLLSILVAAMFVGSAGALTLKEQKKWKDWQEYLKSPDQSYIGKVKEKCGYEIPLTMEEKFVTPFMAANAHAASYCDSTRSAISGMCADDTSKAAIAKNIKKIVCKYAAKEGEVGFALNGGTLTMTVGLNAANLDAKVTEYLENNLK